ncbi:MAG: adenylate/guanylate cyclase domain-containing protein [Gemmatimonadota bacterium]
MVAQPLSTFLSGRTVNDIAISRHGDHGVLVTRIEKPIQLQERGTLGLPVHARLSPRGLEAIAIRVVVGSDWPIVLGPPARRWQVPITDALSVFSTVTMGEYLDRIGVPVVRAEQEPEELFLKDILDILNGREAATFEEIETYLKGKIYWSWQYRHPVATITSPDLLRLNATLADVHEVASLRDGEFWSIVEQGGLKPTGQLLDLFAKRVNPPRATASQSRFLAAIFFADIVESTRLAHEQESLALRLIDVFQSVARQSVSGQGGAVVKYTGDGVLARFSNVSAAVRAGHELLADFRSGSCDLGYPAELRIGIHMGEVVSSTEGDIHGDAVNVAARVQGVAPRGRIAVSEEAWRQLQRSSGFRYDDLGVHELKGVGEPLRLYTVEANAPSA